MRMARSTKGGKSRLGPLVAVGGGRGADRSKSPGAWSHARRKYAKTSNPFLNREMVIEIDIDELKE